MPDLRDEITREGKKLRSLHERVRETFRQRDKDRPAWSEACKAFHAYRPWWDSYVEQIQRKRVISSQGVLEFMITFLEVDPWFFGSGYLKEKMIQRLKQATLTEVQKARLRTVSLDAVLRRPHREFKHYCRLARAVRTPDFVGNVERIAANPKDGAQRYRARSMLEALAS